MLLAALPATPVQLAHACYQLGFEIVVPASWGDELVAHAVLEDLRQRNREPVIQCTCPLVYERLLANGQHLLPAMVQTASPAVAVARYARQAFAPHLLTITYVGACPGARHPSIDERCVPDELLRALAEHDISIADMPTVFDSVLPPDRRRFASLPGGCPTQEALWQASDGRMLREVTQPTFSTDLAQTLVWREHVMIDVAPSLGCACAGSCNRLGARSGRVAVMAVEPPRATQPVVNFRPEYTAPVQWPSSAEATNGDTPVHRTVRPRDGREPFTAPAGDRAPAPAPVTVSRTRTRVRTTTPLPRAYLAKRRHLASTGTATEPAQPAETVLHAAEAPTRTVDEQPQAESVLVQEPAAPTESPASAPNEEPGPVDAQRPIAVHVEPEPPQTQEAAAQSDHIVDREPAYEIRHDKPALRFEESVVESVAATTVTEFHGWTPPLDRAVTVEEPVREAVPAAERSGPLRVEVEIFEEAEPAPPPDEVVIPDAVETSAARKPESLEPAIAVQPRRPWADFLITLWLVLVASAVIAALLWRR